MNAFLVNKRMDVVDFDGLKLFMFEEDNLYKLAVPEERKHQDLDAYQRACVANGFPKSPVTPANVDQVTSARYGTFVAMDFLWKQGVDFVVLDIGSHVGDFGLKAANFIRTCGRKTQVITFDPSEAGALVPCSIGLNKLEAIAKHEALAVSDIDGYVLFQYRAGHAGSAEIAARRQGAAALGMDWLKRYNQLPLLPRLKGYFSLGIAALKRLVRGGRIADGYTLIVRSVDILSYLTQNGHPGNIFAKIDIEGHDAFVINQLLKEFAKRQIYIIFEFTPARYADHAAAAEYLQKLGADFYIFDLYYCPNPTRFRRIEPADAPAFVKEISERQQGYTDVFLLDKRTPAGEELVKRLSGLKQEPDALVL